MDSTSERFVGELLRITNEGVGLCILKLHDPLLLTSTTNAPTVQNQSCRDTKWDCNCLSATIMKPTFLHSSKSGPCVCCRGWLSGDVRRTSAYCLLRTSGLCMKLDSFTEHSGSWFAPPGLRHPLFLCRDYLPTYRDGLNARTGTFLQITIVIYMVCYPFVAPHSRRAGRPPEMLQYRMIHMFSNQVRVSPLRFLQYKASLWL